MSAAEQQLQGFIAEAHELGVTAAKNAASWVTDGRTSGGHYAKLFRMMQEGDPELDSALPPQPNLSGEWADAPTPGSLFEEVTGLDAHAESSWNHDAYQHVLEAICQAWEEAVSETFAQECERLVHEALADDTTCGTCGRSWNQYVTPTPSARCPFEYEHEEDLED